MRAKKVIIEIAALFCRYACAIAVAFLVSYLVIIVEVTVFDIGLTHFLSGANMIGVTSQRLLGSNYVAFSAAFVGVFSGSYCLTSRSRKLACVVLTILGLMYYSAFWYVYWRHEFRSKHGNDPLVVPLVLGGACAFWLTSAISRKKAKNNPLSASSSDVETLTPNSEP